MGDETVVRSLWVPTHSDFSQRTPITGQPLLSLSHTYSIEGGNTERLIHERWLVVVFAGMCVNILSCVIKNLETPWVIHTHILTDTLMGVGIFPLPQSELVVEVFWEAERACVYLLYEGLYNCKKKFGEERANVPAMHHFIINNHVEIKMLTLSDLTDG